MQSSEYIMGCIPLKFFQLFSTLLFDILFSCNFIFLFFYIFSFFYSSPLSFSLILLSLLSLPVTSFCFVMFHILPWTITLCCKEMSRLYQLIVGSDRSLVNYFARPKLFLYFSLLKRSEDWKIHNLVLSSIRNCTLTPTMRSKILISF